MPPQYRRFATLQPYLQSNEPAGGGGTTPSTPPTDPPKPDDTPLGDAGKKALDDEREARRLADKRAKDAEKELADLKAAATKREEEEQAEQGRWKELAEKRDAELSSATTNLEAATAELTTLRDYVNADIKAAIKDLPKALIAFDPGEDAPLAQRLDWLTKAKANAAEIAASTAKPGLNGNPPAATGAFDLDAAVKQAKARGRYRV